jgi:hypothetical protein
MLLPFVVGEPEVGLSMSSNLGIGVVGGGFGGLYTVFFLKKFFPQGIDITLFDKNNYFLYTPVLHEMATGTVNARHVVIPIRKVVDARDVHIRCEEVTRIDLEKRIVESSSGGFKFDQDSTLVPEIPIRRCHRKVETHGDRGSSELSNTTGESGLH